MAQKVEVITSVERRRRYSDEEKSRFVEESLEPGVSVATVARRHGVSPSLLFAWRKAARIGGSSTESRLAVSGIAGDIVRQIEAELALCRKTTPRGRKRIRSTPRLRALVSTALGAGLSVGQVATVTGVPRSTVKSWQDAAPESSPAKALPAPKELTLVEAARPVAAPLSAVTPVAGRVSVRIGRAVTIDLPAEALTEDVLRILLAVGGGS